MRKLTASLTLMTLIGWGGMSLAAETPKVPAGDYKLDPAHSTLLMRLNHLGFSRYVARFTRFDAKLKFDPAKPATSQLTVTVDPKSLDADAAPKGFMDTLTGPEWLNAGKFPELKFVSTKVEPTASGGLKITGNLTLHGVTKPVVLNGKYNGGYAGHPMDPHARIGFSATGTFKRSDFGVTYGIPAPGTTMGVGDEVEVLVETEFSGPPLAPAAG